MTQISLTDSCLLPAFSILGSLSAAFLYAADKDSFITNTGGIVCGLFIVTKCVASTQSGRRMLDKMIPGLEADVQKTYSQNQPQEPREPPTPSEPTNQ